MRMYQTFSMVNFDDSKYNFNSTDYTSLLLKSDDSVPSSVATTTPLSYQPPNTNHSTTKSFTLISPYTLSTVALIEGTMSLNIKVGVRAAYTGSGTIEATQVDVRVYLVDADTNETDIMDETVWTGSISGTVSNGQEFLSLMYWVDVLGIGIDYDHRLACDIDISYNITGAGGGSADWEVMLSCDNSVPETSITLPFVIGG